VREPKVFLMDEPLSNLDAKLRVATRAEISKLHQRLETTVIYVTHDQVEAMTMGHRIAVMKDGILQQLDTPQMLYDNPHNMFVAGFIGSPAMNFFDARITGTAEEMWIDGGSFKLEIPARFNSKLAPYLNKEVVFGMRPEDCFDKRYFPGAVPEDIMTAQVDVVEPMGSEVYLYLLAGTKQFIGRMDSRTQVRPGDKLDVAVNIEHMHIFDKQTQMAVV
jgi:multiple sugar transport system ATP-binding protein